ncbi:oxidoreductase NAD-binding domain-containing protein 1-like isoform X2 [Oratosquilla oratoria]|uniref:oxidoreductase NAD-binding domain-containing protein 1-like isoform X2 n=1 Tax=Oratosquilla oratoria TaxID=337810 RepID=UPI003F7746C7
MMNNMVRRFCTQIFRRCENYCLQSTAVAPPATSAHNHHLDGDILPMRSREAFQKSPTRSPVRSPLDSTPYFSNTAGDQCHNVLASSQVLIGTNVLVTADTSFGQLDATPSSNEEGDGQEPEDANDRRGGGAGDGGGGRGKHLRITALHTREPVLSKAIVTDIRQESPTVLGLTLRVTNPGFYFKAGQWVDMFIPGLETVGGFSMYSDPAQLENDGTIDLGIKFTKWPPAFWVHKQCHVGSSVAIRAGGDFFYSPEIGDPTYDLLLIAGGVGINPLASILFHAAHLHNSCNPDEYKPGRVKLLYTARTPKDLLYKVRFDELQMETSKVSIEYFCTRQQVSEDSGIHAGKIQLENIRQAIEELDMDNMKALICGPPPMIEAMDTQLLACGLSSSQIYYEKWW